MTDIECRGITEQLSLPNDRSMKEVSRNLCPPRKRRIPRKPTPAQIERFEALRARVMGGKLHSTLAGALAHEQKR